MMIRIIWRGLWYGQNLGFHWKGWYWRGKFDLWLGISWYWGQSSPQPKLCQRHYARLGENHLQPRDLHQHQLKTRCFVLCLHLGMLSFDWGWTGPDWNMRRRVYLQTPMWSFLCQIQPIFLINDSDNDRHWSDNIREHFEVACQLCNFNWYIDDLTTRKSTRQVAEPPIL